MTRANREQRTEPSKQLNEIAQLSRHPGGRQPGSIIDVNSMMDPGLRHAGMTEKYFSNTYTDKHNTRHYFRLGHSLFLACSLLTLLCSLCAAVDTPPRLFFSDAKLSFGIPANWEMGSSFPFGPLLTRKTQEGTEASIVCQISEPVDPSRLSSDTSVDILKNFATRDLAVRSAGSRLLAGTTRTLAGQNAYEVTWLLEGTEGTTQHQSVYFFKDNRFYVLTLKAARDSFPWIVQDYQNWLSTIHLLSREGSGKLKAPSHGGLWVHQTGGAKIEIPEDWLIGVADDRQLGATIARDKMQLAFSAVVDTLAASSREMTPQEKEEARKSLKVKGFYDRPGIGRTFPRSSGLSAGL